MATEIMIKKSALWIFKAHYNLGHFWFKKVMTESYVISEE